MGTSEQRDWIVDDDINDRFPIYTRGNVGEVFPDVVAPLTWDLVGFMGAELGWRDAFQRFGVFDHDEFRPNKNDVLACFGGYCYLNVSISRILGLRVPGLTPELVDYSLFGAQSDAPPYQPQHGDESARHTERATTTLGWILSVDDLPELREHRQQIDRLRADRPDLSTLSDHDLFDRVAGLYAAYWRPLFAQHLFNTYSALIGAGIAGNVAEQLGDPTLAMKMVAGIGDVDSAAPSVAMWELGRMAAASVDLTAAFERGTTGLAERLQQLDSRDGREFVAAFDAFLYEFGSRGPNEWELRSPTWETCPELALVAIDRMRVSPPESAPLLGAMRGAAERERIAEVVAVQLADQPEVLAQVQAGLRAAALFLAARERSKTTIVKMINEARVAAHELGRRMVERGDFDDVTNFGVLRGAELLRCIDDPAPFRQTIREREARLSELSALEPPFVLVGSTVPTASWARRGEATVETATPGTELVGIPGSPGQSTGRARIIRDPADGGVLEPGDVLIAPLTDPSWTPLFVAAGAVIVDVGAQVSHAVIVSRELGIPCVVSVTAATRRIPNGTFVSVDGTTGVVTVLAG